MSRSYFVTGTDTDVGKTVVSAALCQKLAATYWKPIQSGTPTDSERVKEWIGCPVLEEAYRFVAPLSPHQAAARESRAIDLNSITLPECAPLIVEGAGGVLVPLNDHALMLDLIVQLALPVIVVARSKLGTINHTLLTLQALRSRGVVVAGVILNGEPNEQNKLSIERYGSVRVLGELPPLGEVSAKVLAEASAEWF